MSLGSCQNKPQRDEILDSRRPAAHWLELRRNGILDKLGEDDILHETDFGAQNLDLIHVCEIHFM